MSRRRSQSKTEAALKIIPAAFLLLVLLMTGGDLRKFPAMLNQALSLLLVAAVIAVIGLIAFLVFRKLRSRSLPTDFRNPPSSASDHTLRQDFGQPRPSKPSRPSQRLDTIDWFQFEKTIGRLLELQGWTVEMRGGAQEDGGIDLIATRGTETQLVQCKYWKSWDLNLRTVRELVGSRESAEFKSRNASAWIYTLSDPTERALKFASENAVGIVARTELERRLDNHPLSAFPELEDPNKKSCPKCGAPMVNRGKFWGCSNFGRTRCRGTIQISQE